MPDTQNSATFESFERDFIIGQNLMRGFLPALFDALKEEAAKRATSPHNLTPAYDIFLVQAFPNCKDSGLVYYPWQVIDDIAYVSGIKVTAGILDQGRVNGSAVLATLMITSGTKHVLHVNKVENLAVDPEVLYRVAEQYKPKEKAA